MWNVRQQSRPGTAGSQWEPPTDGTAYIGLAYALRQYPNSTEFVYLRRLDRCAAPSVLLAP
jgi:hypothetical protein